MKVVFTEKLIAWQEIHGRHNLPWQVSDPYKIWLSEVMLQQTQVVTVLDYYPRFLERFPTVASLASTAEDEVLALWAGLGYYSRARNLHYAAKQIVDEFNGVFPQSRQQCEQLKGIGRSTAAAIMVFAFQQKETILDGNVKRVLCRVFAQDGEINNKKFEHKLWQLAESLLPENKITHYIQGLMDLGALICTRSKPKCSQCPQQDICLSLKQDLIDYLPRKKVKIKVKEIALNWLLIINENNEILLEKRPASGIWGGLLCVPCLDNLQDMQNYCEQLLLNIDDAEEQINFSHRLTHRLLYITPYILRVKSLRHSGFIPINQAISSGIPKPLQQLLLAL